MASDPITRFNVGGEPPLQEPQATVPPKPQAAPATAQLRVDAGITEGLLFGPYGDVRRFKAAGIVRGSHRLTVAPPEMWGRYEATTSIAGMLPTTLAQPRRLALETPLHFGVTTRTAIRVIDQSLRVSSRGVGFGAAWLGPAWPFLAPVLSLVERIVLAPDDVVGSTQLRFVANVAEGEHINAVIAATQALLSVADDLVTSGQTFSSTQLLASAAVDAPEDQRSAMMDAVATACSWLGAVPESVGAQVVARPELHVVGRPLLGAVHVTFSADGQVRLAFEGALPSTTTATLTLSPQRPGVIATLSRLGEDRVDDAAVDDAFVVRIIGHAGQARADLQAMRLELLDLAPVVDLVEVTPSAIAITTQARPTTAAAAAAQISLMCEAWRELALERAGSADSAQRS